jgi:predicted alpha/beta superfamily hydrolase
METKSSIVTIPNFSSTHLQNSRNLRVYLPPSYANEPDRQYPVLYMHDGRNLFHPAPLSGVAWEVQKTADQLTTEGALQELIVVGIDNTDDRISEYIHRDGTGNFAEHKAKGQRYEDFLIHEVKPYIDTHFRTKPDREHTAILGSSLGGLVSFYIGFHHAELFSKIGMMSPSFWWADRSVLRELQSAEFPFAESNTKTGAETETSSFQLYIDVGDAETNDVPNYVVDDAKHVTDALQSLGSRLGEDLIFHIAPGATHTESAWRDRLRLPLLYFFGTPANE